MIPGVITSQTGGRQFNAPNLTKYSGFVGGVNATHHALKNYSPAMNNMGRLFMVRPPLAVLKAFAGSDANLYSKDSLFIQFKHMLEYMNTGVTGFQSKSLESASQAIQGGFAGRQFNIPTVTKDPTNSVTFSLFEMDGMPVFDVIDVWMNIIGDENSGLSTYGGWISGGTDANGLEKRLYRRASESDEGIPYNEANHTAEFIYVMHDRSGAQANRAVLLADCYPTELPQGEVFNMDNPGQHDTIKYSIPFNCVVYRSPIITAIANDLLKQYRIVSNSLNFNPELGDAVYANDNANLFNKALGAVPVDSATGTNIGNVPVFRPSNTPKTVVTADKDMNDAKLAGQPNRMDGTSWDGFATD